MIKLYNSLTKRVEVFSPLKEGNVGIYSCGPTVYDKIHVGNLRSFIYADTLNRVLEASGYEVNHAMNITDVDDKTIKRSREDYPEDSPESALKSLTELYEAAFKTDMEKVGNRLGKLIFINATNSVQLMQDLIKELYEAGVAYIADDGIYFSIEAYKKSGKKYGQLLDIESSNTSQARINNDEYDKQSAHDFALWKFMQPDEPTWSFIVDGKDYLGRPGWHIECSAMSTHLLGLPFDIHTGGVDLIFPHHENEIAQSTATVKSDHLAKYFVHNEHILFDNRKMSKSLGNVLNLEDIIIREIDPLAFRLLVLQSHYRSQSDFTWEILASAQNRLKNLQNLSSLRFQIIEETRENSDSPADIKSDIKEAMEDDFDTPKTLAIISRWGNTIEQKLLVKNELANFEKTLGLIDQYLGLNLLGVEDISPAQKKKVSQRQEARDQSNWEKGDEIRIELEAEGIGLRDSKFGAIWFRL